MLNALRALLAGVFAAAVLMWPPPAPAQPAGDAVRETPGDGRAPGPGGPTAAAPFILALDPGHGGRDFGSRGPVALVEKDFTLRVAKLLARRLGRWPQVRVIFTRESDTEVSAVRRSAIANHNGASLLLSIQADASWRPNARGPSIMVAAPQRPPRVEGEGPDALALRWQRGQNIHLAASRRFALRLQERFTKIGGGRKPPIRSLLLRAIEGARMPAAYINLGVISTPEEAARLREMSGEDPYIEAIEAEIVHYAKLPALPPDPESGTPAVEGTPPGGKSVPSGEGISEAGAPSPAGGATPGAGAPTPAGGGN